MSKGIDLSSKPLALSVNDPLSTLSVGIGNTFW